MIDVEAVRADTPACRDLIHFNNAGASLMPRPVAEALHRHLALEETVGGYEAESRAEAELTTFYTEFAALLNARADEIGYVENATRAWDMAFYGLPLKPGDRILAHASEYVSNYLGLLHQAKRRGLEIDLVPSDETGQIDLAAMERLIGPRTRLLALTHVPTQGGLVNPAAEAGRIAKAQGLIYMLDACQSAGQIALDVQALGCDVLSGTGRKFLRGPRGTGFLYVRRAMLDTVEPAFIDLRAADWTGSGSYALAPGARRYENWESYIAGRIGLIHAVRYARGLGLPAIEARVRGLGAALREALASVQGVAVHDQGAVKCGIVTFAKAGESAPALAARLREKAINVSVTAQSSALLDFSARGIDALVRASVHYYNTEDEIGRFADTVASL
jgi:selenocysteine lyase/cysteine desulfurase